MDTKCFVKPILCKGLAVSLLVILFLAVTPRLARAQEIGNFCVQDYRPGANCTANDVRIEQLKILQLVKPCNVAPTGVMDVVFEVLVSSAGSPDRYDIGLYLALDAGQALSGDSCYHDYLPPPITTTPAYGDFNLDNIPDIYNGPWWNGESNRPTDTCGDIFSSTQLFRVTQQIRVSCTDLDGNGAADISVCTSWDNNTNTTCSSVQEAIPGTGSKCSCSVANFNFTPSAIKEATFSAKSSTAPAYLIPVVLGLLLLIGAALSAYARYRMDCHPPA